MSTIRPAMILLLAAAARTSRCGGGGNGGDASAADGGGPKKTYDETVLGDRPVGYWTLAGGAATEPDASGHGHVGSYQGGTPAVATMPNGDRASDFDGATQFLTIPSSGSFSIPTTGSLTWEGWIRPDVLQFPEEDDGKGFVEWMGKCAGHGPNCEWKGRFYSTTNPAGRCNRLSAYVFNAIGGEGSGADFQPDCGLFQPAHWYHVVGEYTTRNQPTGCKNTAAFPGSINIWVNGVPWNQARHGQSGCMSQFSVVPKASDSPFNIGTVAQASWFPGAVGKVALYDHLLSQAQITAHFQAMAGRAPSGSCSDTCTIPVL
jgi:hypothetical protein